MIRRFNRAREPCGYDDDWWLPVTSPMGLGYRCPPSLNLIHVIPAVSEEASGPSYSVVRLCDTLRDQGHALTLAALDRASQSSLPAYLRVFRLGNGPRRLGRSPAMSAWLETECSRGKCDIVHNHGMWHMSTIYPAEAASRYDVPLVWSPRGSFAPWAMRHGSKAKGPFWALLQRPALVQCNCFHATALTEYRDIRRLGFRQPVCVIPNGIDLRPLPVREKGPFRTLLYLARLHPVKGLENLLEAWAKVEAAFPDWKLRIVGDDSGDYGSDGYGRYLHACADRLDLKRFEFAGAKYGEAKFREYRNADLYVLPSFTENFGITVAEALSMETPVIASHGAPWAELSAKNAGWWVANSPAALADCLSEALSMPPRALSNMGGRGREWMAYDFDWSRIGDSMNAVYEWISGRSRAKPDCVIAT